MLLSGTVYADGTVSGWNRFVYLAYRLEVTSYCSLTTQRAVDGYQQMRQELLIQYRFNKSLIESAQGEAWKLAYREWDNRGLGGFRRWCARDGQHYLDFLESIPVSDKN